MSHMRYEESSNIKHWSHIVNIISPFKTLYQTENAVDLRYCEEFWNFHRWFDTNRVCNIFWRQRQKEARDWIRHKPHTCVESNACSSGVLCCFVLCLGIVCISLGIPCLCNGYRLMVTWKYSVLYSHILIGLLPWTMSTQGLQHWQDGRL